MEQEFGMTRTRPIRQAPRGTVPRRVKILRIDTIATDTNPER